MADDQVSITISADIAQLQSALQQAASAFQQVFLAEQRFAADGAQAWAQLWQNNGQVTQRTLAAIGVGHRNAASEVDRAWRRAGTQIEHSLTTALAGVITGSTTFSRAMQRVAQQVLQSFEQVGIAMVKQWLQNELAMTAARQAGNALRTASDAQAGAESAAIGAANTKTSVIQHAWSAAAAVYDDVAQIPYVGWILAPPAAAAAAAAVLAFGGSIPSAAGGLWSVPSDTLAFVHQNETVLPAAIAGPMRGFFENDGAATGAGDIHFHVQAMDSQDVARFLKRNGGAIAKALRGEARNFNADLHALAG